MLDRKRGRPAAAAVALVVCLAGATAAQAATVETVAKGLNNPRGVSVAPDGSVYIASAGKGGPNCFGKGEGRQCLGNTGSIVRVAGADKQGGRRLRLGHVARRRLRGSADRRFGGS